MSCHDDILVSTTSRPVLRLRRGSRLPQNAGRLVSISCVIGVVAIVAGVMVGLFVIFAGFAVEWFLLSRRRRRIGRDLVGPLPLMPGSAACAVGIFMIWPRLLRLTGQFTIVDKASPVWRGVVLATGSALVIAFVSVPFTLTFMSDSCTRL